MSTYHGRLSRFHPTLVKKCRLANHDVEDVAIFLKCTKLIALVARVLKEVADLTLHNVNLH
jgi:hypothetical protein